MPQQKIKSLCHSHRNSFDDSTGRPVADPGGVRCRPARRLEAGRAVNDSLQQMRAAIEEFLRSAAHPRLLQDEAELIDLGGAEWRLSVNGGRLIFEAWSGVRSVRRRLEEVAYRDDARLGVRARHPNGSTVMLEFRALQQVLPPGRPQDRTAYREALAAMLAREYPGWKLEKISSRSDREHAFSAWFTRGIARRGQQAWAFLGLGPQEQVAAADAALAHALNWLHWLRGQADRHIFGGLRLFLPPAAAAFNAPRIAWLDERKLVAEMFEWQPGMDTPRLVEPEGNCETALAPRHHAESLLERHRAFVADMLGDAAPAVDALPDSLGRQISLRVFGLEVARVEGAIVPDARFGLEGQSRRLTAERRGEWQRFLRRVIELRCADSPERQSVEYQMQPERWLESLLVRDLSRLDPALRGDVAYQQVPAISGSDRGVVDLLGVTRQGRLAVIELKLEEDLVLPLQGLDYWLRVKWLNECGRFSAAGYFPGMELHNAPPLLYLVSLAFRFHSSLAAVTRYLRPQVEILQVGLGQNWRQQVQVLFRRTAHPEAPHSAAQKLPESGATPGQPA